MCHIKKKFFFNRIYRKYRKYPIFLNENIRYFQTKISDIYCDIYRANPAQKRKTAGRLSSKIALRLKKVCYEVSLCENC